MRFVMMAALALGLWSGTADTARAQAIVDPADVVAYVAGADPASLANLAPLLPAAPGALIDVGGSVGVPLVFNLLPVVDVLANNPGGLPGLLLGGGPLVSPAISGLPPIPLINTPRR